MKKHKNKIEPAFISQLRAEVRLAFKRDPVVCITFLAMLICIIFGVLSYDMSAPLKVLWSFVALISFTSGFYISFVGF